MKTFETKKLFYNKHLYKVTLSNNLANFFTKQLNKNKFSYAKKGLDNLFAQHTAGKTMYRSLYKYDIPISLFEFAQAKKLLDYLLEVDSRSYILRTERRSISITSNNLEWLTNIKNNIVLDEWWEPKDNLVDVLKNNSKIVIVNKPSEYTYKVYLKSKTDVRLSDWLKTNKTISKIGTSALHNIESNYYTNGNYFYIKDEKTLFLLKITFANSIQKIEKLIYKGDVDKYTYG